MVGGGLETKAKEEGKLLVSSSASVINQIPHNPLRKGPPPGLGWTRSAGRGASIGVAVPMLTAPGSEGEGGGQGAGEEGVCGGGATEEICLCKGMCRHRANFLPHRNGLGGGGGGGINQHVNFVSEFWTNLRSPNPAEITLPVSTC